MNKTDEAIELFRCAYGKTPKEAGFYDNEVAYVGKALADLAYPIELYVFLLQCFVSIFCLFYRLRAYHCSTSMVSSR